MRIKVLLKAKKLPVLYRHRIMSLIKEALKRSDEDYKEFLYNNKTSKPFTFNLVLLKKPRKGMIKIDNKFNIEDDVVDLDNPVSLYISSMDYRFLISVINGLKRMKVFNFSQYESMMVDGESIDISILDIYVINEKPILSDSIIFKTNSPILLEDKEDNPILFNEERFEKELNEITNRIMLSPHIKGRLLEKPLKFEAIDMQKVVIKHTLKSFREKTNKPIMYLTANKGIFRLSGDPQDLEILYKIGIGNRTGQGFGMVEII